MSEHDRARQRLESMLRIRRVEEALIRLHHDGAFPGHYHVYVGQEATAVAACEQLLPQDYVFTTHRNHGHLLARGAAADRVLAEILGKADGYCGGKGGTLHLAVRELNIPATSALVGGSLPLATGAALGLKIQGGDAIVASFFGDGVLEEGAFYEALNLAGVWDLPVLYICENNSIPPEQRRAGQYPSSTHSAAQLSDVPHAFQIPCEVVDGADMDGLVAVFARLAAAVRSERRPRFVEVRGTRWPGSVSLWPELISGETNVAWAWRDVQPPAELADWLFSSDPLTRMIAAVVQEDVLSKETVRDLDKQVRKQVAEAVEFAKASPYPEAAQAYQHTGM